MFLRRLVQTVALAIAAIIIGVPVAQGSGPCVTIVDFQYRCKTGCYVDVPQCTAQENTRSCDLVTEFSCCGVYNVGVYGSNNLCSSPAAKNRKAAPTTALTKYAGGKQPDSDYHCKVPNVVTK
jgi:hypothetical protein